jgi:hypothetical protein
LFKQAIIAVGGIAIGFAAITFGPNILSPKSPAATPQASQAIVAENSPIVTDRAPRREVEPFSFRGITLGITISEFKAIPFPDAEKWPGTRVFCSNGDVPARSFTMIDAVSELGKAGVISCAYFAPKSALCSDNRPVCSFPEWTEWAPEFAGVGNYLMSFRFTPPKPYEPSRLYSIITQPQVDKFERVSAALMARYGLATKSEGVTTQVWDNGVSTITIRKYVPRATQMSVVYAHKTLEAGVAGMVLRNGGRQL